MGTIPGASDYCRQQTEVMREIKKRERGNESRAKDDEALHRAIARTDQAKKQLRYQPTHEARE